ncbi:MAG TPA: ABC transporter substrate-binding protein [Actinoplanes sp.]|nr:ABC transporter substrate-binding protein [Actinoplanes sp.]
MKRLLTAVAAATVLFVAGCADSAPDPTVAPSGPAAAYPQRIVSLSPTATEMLFAIGAGPQVTAVDDQSSFPAEAPRTDLSGFKPNAEAIAAKDPDLVVLSGDADGIVAQLERLSIPVVVSPAAADLDGTYRGITELGRLTGHQIEAGALNDRMAADIDTLVKSVPARNKPLSYYYELGPDLYSATSATFIGSVFGLFGMTNVADASDPDGKLGGYPQLSQEAVVEANPDTIFLADTKCCAQSAETVKARPGWASVTAVAQGRIHPLDDDIASRWGPRTVDLVRAVADAVK